jgi:hypothetical protein
MRFRRVSAGVPPRSSSVSVGSVFETAAMTAASGISRTSDRAAIAWGTQGSPRLMHGCGQTSGSTEAKRKP